MNSLVQVILGIAFFIFAQFVYSSELKAWSPFLELFHEESANWIRVVMYVVALLLSTIIFLIFFAAYIAFGVAL